MVDRKEDDLLNTSVGDTLHSDSSPEPAPIDDVAFFNRLRDLVRTEYLWKWDDQNDESKKVIKSLDHNIRTSGGFRLVGDIAIEDDVFDLTLWLEEPLAFTLGDVDIMLLESLAIDLGRSTLFMREMSKQGLMYHIVGFGDGRAREIKVNVIGPRMQQIRDLRTLVVPAIDSFSA